MAVQSTLTSSALILRYKEGVDSTGNDIIRSKRFSNVKVTAASENLFNVSTALGALMKYPITQVLRNDENTITNA